MTEKLKPIAFNHCFHTKDDMVHVENAEGNNVTIIWQDRSFELDCDILVDAIYGIKE